MTQDRLGPYFVTTQRYSPQLGGREGVRGLVDGIVNELQLPCTLDNEGDWRLTTDVGPVLITWHDDSQRLRIIQFLDRLTGRPKSNADLMLLLLRLNTDAETACFAAGSDPEAEWLTITGLIPAEEVTRDEVERVLEDVLRMSRKIDELTGKSPSQAAAAAQGAPAGQPATAQPAAPVTDIPAGWYSDPRAEKRMRYWDGATWTDHTAD